MLKNFSKKDFTATNILIIITILMYIIQINISNGGVLFGLNLYFLVYSFWWQPLTSIFAHGGIAHLGMNMFVLWQFGNLIERFIGAKKLVALYLITGLLTSILSFDVIALVGKNSSSLSVQLVNTNAGIISVKMYMYFFICFLFKIYNLN